jgi:hypothetical protein
MAVKDPNGGIVVGVVGDDHHRPVRGRCPGRVGGGESVWALDEGDTVEGRRENMFGILTEAEEVKHGVSLVQEIVLVLAEAAETKKLRES